MTIIHLMINAKHSDILESNYQIQNSSRDGAKD
jgi:hypothetical protein